MGGARRLRRCWGGTFEKVPPLVEAGNDQTLSGRVPGLASLICSPSDLSLKKMHLAANNEP